MFAHYKFLEGAAAPRENVVPFQIRPATIADIPALASLMTDFYAEAEIVLPPAPAARAFEALLGDPTLGSVWLAHDTGRAIGHVVLALTFSMEYGGLRGFIDDLYVRPSARGQGAGAALLEAARADALARGLRVLQVETGPAPHPARPLYARAGYVDSGHALLTLPLAPPLHEA